MKYYLFALLILVLVIAPLGVSDTHAALVTCGTKANPTACGMCDIFSMINVIIIFVVKQLAPLVAVVLFLIAGFLMIVSGPKPALFERAKKMMTDTIIGLVIIYSSFLITNTILVAFAGSSNISKDWFKIQCSYTEPFIPIGPPASSGDVSATQYTDEQARQALNSNVTVKDGASLQGINKNTVNEVNRMQAESKCPIVITEGTGGDHAEGAYSHATGYKVDLRSKDGSSPNCLTRYITSTYTQLQLGTKFPTYVFGSKQYILENYGTETEHWDVTVK